jgi:hypothetical protein
MKDFAIIVRSKEGQAFGVSGEYILKHEQPMTGCTNRWQFQLPNDEILEVIIVSAQKKALAVWAGHWYEVLKSRVRRFGTNLSQI